MEGELESFWKYGKLKNENINKSTKRNGCFNMVKRFIRLFAIVDTKMDIANRIVNDLYTFKVEKTKVDCLKDQETFVVSASLLFVCNE
jgi:hypothetical protein